jgi:hypothetical protein
VITTVAAQGQSIHALANDPAIELTAAMLIGGTSQAVLDWLDGRLACSRNAFTDDLIALWELIGDGTAALVRGRGAAE